MKKCLCFLALAFMLLFLSGQTFAQSGTTGAIEGKVFDEEGKPLPGVEIKLSSPDLIGGTQAKLTTTAGKFRFAALPRGTYTAEASLPGFNVTKRENILLFVGQTITIDLNLKIATLNEEVTVIGTAPLVDVKDSMINATNLDEQLLQTVGAESRWKNVNSLINFAPGVLDGTAMGANEGVSNQWQIDGVSVNTYVATGDGWNSPDINIIEEAQVSGSGANAEYGGYTGVVLNLITKSGGNNFEGMFEVSYSPLSWGSENVDFDDPKFSLFKAPPRTRYFDGHFGLGGPIIKDKLWFYASVGYVQQDSEVQGLSEFRSRRDGKGFGKLTFHINSSNRISAWFEYENVDIQNQDLSVTRPLDATYLQGGPGFPMAINYLHTFSENTFTEIKVGRFEGLYEEQGKNGRDVSQRYDYLTGMYSGNGYYYWSQETTHYNASASLSHHADEFIAGSHDFKVGVEFVTGNDYGVWSYNGGRHYADNVYGYSYQYYDYRYLTYAYEYGYDAVSNGHRVSAFAQDAWKIGDRLTINPGVRWSMHRGYLPNMQKDAFYKPKNALEFRLGLTYDVFGDHTTALKAHYGRFHESFKTWYFSGADPSQQDWVMYEVLKDGSFLEVYRESYSTAVGMDPDIKVPSSDQFTLGLERTLMRDTTISLTFVHRTYKDFIARATVDAMYELNPWTYVDENGQEQTIEIYRQNRSYEEQMDITNPKEGQSSALILTPKNKYTGFSFALNKRFSNGWMFHIDYTYSVAKGNHPNDWETGAWGFYYYNNPNRQINGYGNLLFDVPHALHAYGTVTLPWGINLSPRIMFRSGRNWTRTVTGPSWAGRAPIKLEPRGSQRLPSRFDIDLRLEKVFTLTDRMKIGLIFDMFNVANSGVETGMGSNVGAGSFGKAMGVNAPRYLRLGLRFFF